MVELNLRSGEEVVERSIFFLDLLLYTRTWHVYMYRHLTFLLKQRQGGEKRILQILQSGVNFLARKM